MDLVHSQGLKEEINNKEKHVMAVIKQAEQLVMDNTKNKSQGEKGKDETSQQFQKLKFSAADLKVRFDMVSSCEFHVTTVLESGILAALEVLTGCLMNCQWCSYKILVTLLL